MPVCLSRVRERDRTLRHREREVERRLVAWLVEARKSAARVVRLELRERVGAASLVDAVETAKPFGERRVVGDVELRIACRCRVVEGEHQLLGLGLERRALRNATAAGSFPRAVASMAERIAMPRPCITMTRVGRSSASPMRTRPLNPFAEGSTSRSSA